MCLPTTLLYNGRLLCLQRFLTVIDRTNGNPVSSSSGFTDDADLEEQVLFEDIRDTADIIEVS
jgi:hypothetical protein